jgi:type IV pilus assembly protein PilY1
MNATIHTRRPSQLLAALAGIVYAAFATVSVHADDTEIFFNQNIGNVPANILFILDTSGSMNDTVTSQQDYDPGKSYSPDKCASFDPNYYYFSTKGNPACGTTNKILAKQFKCATMMSGINSSGYATDSFVMWGSTTANKSSKKSGITTTTATQTYGWQKTLDATNTKGFVECKLDAGKDGDGIDNTKLYASTDTFSMVTTTVTPPGTVTVTGSVTGGQLTGVWDASKNYFQASVGTGYTIYSANYLNWLYDSSQTSTASKMWTMESAASSLISSLSGVNVGLMRYNYGGKGGMVMAPIADLSVGTNRQDRINMVKSWAPAGITPLSESLYEAYLYFSGGAVNYGLNSTSTTCTTWTSPNNQCSAAVAFSAPSVAGSRTGGSIASKTYDSPADYSCRKNFVVFLTDGLPNEASAADGAIQALPNFASLAGACDTTTFAGQNGGKCTGALAQYMYNTDLRPDISKVQNVTSYFIGFGGDFLSGGAPTAAFQYLDKAATRGGGKAYTADSLSGLTDAFNQILAEVIKTNTTFTAPAVAVNAFNRTQTLDDLYVSVFSPRLEYHWPGNVKKYKFIGGQVVDSLGNPAVDSGTGYFKDGTQSYWSSAPDGSDVTLGGAASRLPNFDKRTIYTTLQPGVGSYPNLIDLSDGSLTATDFNLTATDPGQLELVSWAYGQDTQDAVPPAGTADTRHEMGDPIHTQPVVVIYGKKGDGTDDTVVYAPTNDGYLHAIDGSMNAAGGDTSSSGQEMWAYVPSEMLPHLKDLYNDDQVTSKHYGIDGAITVLRYDANSDGTISGDDRVILYFSTGRNPDTAAYYALDVTDKTKPKLLWKIDASTLPGLGQAWSQAQVVRVNVGGTSQNSQHLALVMGAGYDAAEDNYTYYANDGVGKGIYIVDALYGTLLWRAGGTGSGADLVAAKMDHAIPAPVTTVDIDGNGYMDRLYVGDMAAQLWRFDFVNGNPRASFGAGGVIGSFGTHDDLLVHPASDMRRFYAQPDVSLDLPTGGGRPFYNIALGSGYRGHPLDATIHDRFYAIRDYDVAGAKNQAYFNSYSVIRDAGNSQVLQPGPRIVDITTAANPVLPDGSAGWQLDMNTHTDWTAGEKILSAARTSNGQIVFVTYSPNTTPASDPCSGVGAGTNRAYTVSVFNGSATVDRNNDGSLTNNERSQDLRQGGIAPEVAFLFPGSSSGGGGSGPNCPKGQVCGCPPGDPTCKPPDPPGCLVGGETLKPCPTGDRLIKTYWREGQAN